MLPRNCGAPDLLGVAFRLKPYEIKTYVTIFVIEFKSKLLSNLNRNFIGSTIRFRLTTNIVSLLLIADARENKKKRRRKKYKNNSR